MSDPNAVLIDSLWKMYQEQRTHIRHHESQRSSVAAALIAIAGALLGLITFDKAINLSDLPLTLFLLLIGSFGAIFSAKQYERSSLHTERASSYSDAIDELLDNHPLKRVKQDADARHTKQFPKLFHLRLNKFWLGMYLLVAFLGLVLSFVAAFHPFIEL